MAPTQIPGNPVSIPSFSIPVSQIAPLFETLIFIVWAIYTIVAFYHWFRYSDSLTVSIGAMATHLIISVVLAVYAVSGLV